MPITDEGHDNRIDVMADTPLEECAISFRAGQGHGVPHDNRLVIGKGCTVAHTAIILWGHHNNIVINDNVAMHKGGRLSVRGTRNTITIGKDTTIGERWLAAVDCGPGIQLSIGPRCSIASDVVIRTDGHRVFDLQTSQLLNGDADIIIGEHVWIGMRACILKGTAIGHDSVIGAGAVVSGGKAFPPHVVIAGNPAHIVRTAIEWRE